MNYKKVEVSTSELGRALLSFKGKPFSLEGYRPFREVYDMDPPMMTVKCSRQVGKTLSIGAIKVLKCVAIPYFTSLYIAPLSTQASRFSTTYLDPFILSPLVKKYYRDASSKKNVFEKTLSSGSIMFLSYAETEQDADRVRGVAGDAISIDEVQDVALEALPILYETLSASNYAWKRHYGTAKGELNGLEILFKRSSGNEWCTKCDHCGKWNIPDNFESCIKICSGLTGPVCQYCSQPIDFLKGRWVAARPQSKDHIGFHIPRFTLEARTNIKKWNELRSSIFGSGAYSPSKIANEVFGLAAGVAGRILSQREAINCCDLAKDKYDTCWPRDYRGINNVVLGVDWSVTGGVASYTVISILGYDYMGKCYLLYAEKIQGVDILDQVRRVNELYYQFGCQMIGSDRGVGVLQGQLLKEALGEEKVCMVQYTAAKVPARYDSPGRYLSVDRTMVIDSVIMKMKLGREKFETPNWSLTQDLWSDALSVYEEESQSGRRLYRKDEGSTDDWLHSVVFGNCAWMMMTGQFQYVDTLDMTYSSDYEA